MAFWAIAFILQSLHLVWQAHFICRLQLSTEYQPKSYPIVQYFGRYSKKVFYKQIFRLCAHVHAHSAVSPLRLKVLSSKNAGESFFLLFNSESCCCYPKHDTQSQLPTSCCFLACSLAFVKPTWPEVHLHTNFAANISYRLLQHF